MEVDVQHLIVDCPYLSHRSYSSPYHLTTSNGINATLMHSFLQSLLSFHKQLNPDKIILTWESPGTVPWRRLLLPTYKPQKPIQLDFIHQLHDIQLFLHLLGIQQFYSPCNEADDVIATLVSQKKPETIITIFTVDKDIMQLVDVNCEVFDGDKIYSPDGVFKKFGVHPNEIPDFLAIRGDTSDNINGIDGYGTKKAQKIIHQYHSIENIPPDHEIYKYITDLTINKKIATLNKSCDLHELIPQNKSNETLESILDKYQLIKIKEKLKEFKQITKKKSKWL